MFAGLCLIFVRQKIKTKINYRENGDVVKLRNILRNSKAKEIVKKILSYLFSFSSILAYHFSISELYSSWKDDAKTVLKFFSFAAFKFLRTCFDISISVNVVLSISLYLLYKKKQNQLADPDLGISQAAPYNGIVSSVP